jgi:hypothetical protein
VWEYLIFVPTFLSKMGSDPQMDSSVIISFEITIVAFGSPCDAPS